MMKIIKTVFFVTLLSFLAGCNHGFEGEYTTRIGSDNELIDGFSGLLGEQKVIIGRNYIESDGTRTEYDEIFVRKSNNGNRYLVFKNEGSEQEAWQVIDDKTLKKGNQLVSVTLQKIK